MEQSKVNYSTYWLVEESKKIIKMAAQAAEQKQCELELCFSGGKDSEIMRLIAIDAGVKFRAVYKQTTIDRPRTTAYCLERDVDVLRPSETFLQMLSRKGFPTRRCRWCCERLKEYKVSDVALVGVRRSESRQRSLRYNEVSQCRVYHRGGNCEQFFPLLNWEVYNEHEFCIVNKVQLHPHYYDDDGQLQIHRRLGCIGCPLRGDNGKSDFKEFPMMLRQWLISSYKWWNFTKGTTKNKFSSPQKVLIHNLFCRSYKEYVEKFENVLFGFSDMDALYMLSSYFGLSYDILRNDFLLYVEKK